MYRLAITKRRYAFSSLEAGGEIRRVAKTYFLGNPLDRPLRGKEWLLPIETKLITANPLIRADAGKAAIQRGPLVYCVEEADNGKPLATLSLADEPVLSESEAPGLLGGCVVVEGNGVVADQSGWEEGLPYRPLSKKRNAVQLKAIPYYLWATASPAK